jgi:hypothetical protein
VRARTVRMSSFLPSDDPSNLKKKREKRPLDEPVFMGRIYSIPNCPGGENLVVSYCSRIGSP